MARFEADKADASTPGKVFELLTDPEGRTPDGKPWTLRRIAKAWGVPRGRFVEWFTTAHAELYDAALKVRADELAHQALEIADGDGDVARDSLGVNTRLKLASKWDRKRYGEEAEAVRVTPVTIQIANLRGAVEVVLEEKPPV